MEAGAVFISRGAPLRGERLRMTGVLCSHRSSINFKAAKLSFTKM
jgi:hypothetical protein